MHILLTTWRQTWGHNNFVNSKGSPIKNQDLLHRLFAAWDHIRIKPLIRHIKAHTNSDDKLSLGNAEADRLAVLGKLM